MSLDAILDIFGCCLFNWGLVTTILPAFLLAGALVTFLPSALVARALGRDARPVTAYGVGATSGFVLPTCSCNIVPLFMGIREAGAGLGPAIAFLYAGPAINLVSMVWVFQALGWRLGLLRALGVPLLAVLAGVSMALLFRRSEARSPAPAPAGVRVRGVAHPRRAAATLGTLVIALLLGASPLPTVARVVATLLLLAGLAAAHMLWLDREDFYDWMAETWKLTKLVAPLLLVAVLAIGLLARVVPLGALTGLLGSDGPLASFLAALFGALMYFPILSEVVLAKTLLVRGVAAGPVFALLLTGAGLSLPGLLLVRTVLGLRETLTYMALLVALGTGGGWAFGAAFGHLEHDALTAVAFAPRPAEGEVLDTDADGSVDVVTMPIDADRDGPPEQLRVWRYGKDGQLLEAGLDRDTDGKLDEAYRYEYDDNGALLRETHDRDGDGKPERVRQPDGPWQPVR